MLDGPFQGFSSKLETTLSLEYSEPLTGLVIDE